MKIPEKRKEGTIVLLPSEGVKTVEQNCENGGRKGFSHYKVDVPTMYIVMMCWCS